MQITVGLVPSTVIALLLVAAAARVWRGPAGGAAGVVPRAAGPMLLTGPGVVFAGSALLEIAEEPSWFFGFLGAAALPGLVGVSVVLTGRPERAVTPAVRGCPGVATIINARLAGDTGDRDLQAAVVRGGVGVLVTFALSAVAMIALLVPHSTPLDEILELPGPRTMVVSHWTCNARAYVDVDEAPQRVTIAIWTRFNSKADCLDSAEIVLDEPLGDRQVIDAHDGRQLPVPDSD